MLLTCLLASHLLTARVSKHQAWMDGRQVEELTQDNYSAKMQIT